MGYNAVLGQSQVPGDVAVSEVDLPPNLHFNRWGPIGGAFNPITPVLNVVDPLNLFHGGGSAPVQVAPQSMGDQIASALPLVAGLGVAGYAGYYLWKRSKKRKAA